MMLVCREFSAIEVEEKLAAFREALMEDSAVQQREKTVNAAAAERCVHQAALHMPASGRFLCSALSQQLWSRSEKETHWLAEQKQQELARVRDAWGLKDTVEGEAFNRDIQEAKKQARIAQREKDKQEREDRKQQEQEARQKAAKDAEKRRKQVGKAAALAGCVAWRSKLLSFPMRLLEHPQGNQFADRYAAPWPCLPCCLCMQGSTYARPQHLPN